MVDITYPYHTQEKYVSQLHNVLVVFNQRQDIFI